MRAGNRWALVPSKQYEVYETACLWQIPASARQGISSPVNVRCIYYMPTRRAVDLVNLLEATCDILVEGGVLADDNCRIASTHDGSYVTYDKENPRVEITIEPYSGIIL